MAAIVNNYGDHYSVEENLSHVCDGVYPVFR
jgi:hypothetical protein